VIDAGRPTVRARFVLYGVVPFVLLGTMVLMYYSDSPALREIVSPDIEGVHPHAQSEYGLLENLQNVALAAIVVVAVLGLRRKRLAWERAALLILAAGSAFVLLEEIDYGMQYVDDGAPRNLHRIGYTETVLEHAARFGVLTFFGGFAILFANSRRPLLRYLAPDRFSVLTILLLTAFQEIVWKLADRYPLDHGSLSGREIEFAEFGVYYLLLLYSIDMVFWREYEGDAPA